MVFAENARGASAFSQARVFKEYKITQTADGCVYGDINFFTEAGQDTRTELNYSVGTKQISEILNQINHDTEMKTEVLAYQSFFNPNAMNLYDMDLPILMTGTSIPPEMIFDVPSSKAFMYRPPVTIISWH